MFRAYTLQRPVLSHVILPWKCSQNSLSNSWRGSSILCCPVLPGPKCPLCPPPWRPLLPKLQTWHKNCIFGCIHFRIFYCFCYSFLLIFFVASCIKELFLFLGDNLNLGSSLWYLMIALLHSFYLPIHGLTQFSLYIPLPWWCIPIHG